MSDWAAWPLDIKSFPFDYLRAGGHCFCSAYLDSSTSNQGKTIVARALARGPGLGPGAGARGPGPGPEAWGPEPGAGARDRGRGLGGAQ